MRCFSAYLEIIFVSKIVSRLVVFKTDSLAYGVESVSKNTVSKFFKMYVEFFITILLEGFQALACLGGACTIDIMIISPTLLHTAYSHLSLYVYIDIWQLHAVGNYMNDSFFSLIPGFRVSRNDHLKHQLACLENQVSRKVVSRNVLFFWCFTYLLRPFVSS